MRTGTYAVVPLFWINSILSIIIGMNLARFIDSMFNKSFTVAGGWIKYIGKNSITFVCLNQIVIMAWKNLFAKLPSVNKLIICFAILIFSIASLMLMDHIIRKTGLKVAIGK